MGLFSFLNKNKQEPTESGYQASADDSDAAIGAKARSKRASNAGKAAADPVLPEKKRARRRLVGAIALALAVAIGLPMILDSEPKPLATDIDIRIPAKDKPAAETAALPVPANTPAVPTPAAKPAAKPAATTPPPVSAADALDQRETIVEPAKPVKPAPAAARDVAEVKPVTLKPETKPKADAKPAEKPIEKPVADKPAEAKPSHDAERALAILEGKPVTPAAPQKFIVQVAALASQEKVDELQARLKEAGIASFTQKGSGKSGELIRIRVGPFSNKEEGDKVLAKLGKLGLNGKVVPTT
ncbi:MAG: SPOR domain-containing protein [Massilia sp.]